MIPMAPDRDAGDDLYHHYAEQAHQVRMAGIEDAHNKGCTCNPYISVAIVESIEGDLIGLVHVTGHEARCLILLDWEHHG